MERHPLSGEQTLKQIRELKIETERDAGQKFQYRHFRTEPVPNGTQLQTDCARTDHDELLWSFSERERFSAADNCFPIEFCERQFCRRAPRGDHNVLCLDLLRLALGGSNGNFPT